MAQCRLAAWTSREWQPEGLSGITPSMKSIGWGRNVCAQRHVAAARQTASLPSRRALICAQTLRCHLRLLFQSIRSCEEFAESAAAIHNDPLHSSNSQEFAHEH